MYMFLYPDNIRVILILFGSTGAMMLDCYRHFEHLVQTPVRPGFKVTHFMINVFYV